MHVDTLKLISLVFMLERLFMQLDKMDTNIPVFNVDSLILSGLDMVALEVLFHHYMEGWSIAGGLNCLRGIASIKVIYILQFFCGLKCSSVWYMQLLSLYLADILRLWSTLQVYTCWFFSLDRLCITWLSRTCLLALILCATNYFFHYLDHQIVHLWVIGLELHQNSVLLPLFFLFFLLNVFFFLKEWWGTSCFCLFWSFIYGAAWTSIICLFFSPLNDFQFMTYFFLQWMFFHNHIRMVHCPINKKTSI